MEGFIDRSNETKAELIKKIKNREIDSETKTSNYTCYFCLKRIVGKARVLFVDNSQARGESRKFEYPIHEGCYEAVQRGEWESNNN